MKRETIALIAAFLALGTATVVLVTTIFTQRGPTAQQHQLAAQRTALDDQGKILAEQEHQLNKMQAIAARTALKNSLALNGKEKPLPPLNNSDLLHIKSAAKREMDQSLGLAGVGKLGPPPKLDKPLQSFRNQWAKTNPTVTPFLGLSYDYSFTMYPSYLSIFPSRVRGQVCVLQFRPQQTFMGEVEVEEFLSLSTAKVINGQLLGGHLRADKSTILQTDFDNGYPVDYGYTAEFLPVLFGQNGGIVIFALYSPPQLPPEFPEDLTDLVKQELSNRGCTMD
ncbi:MAG: hypothetical protein INR81_19060 [Microcystis aeruginosa PMC 728.11]|nr:hypothetical protein [Microcystis aeruginosa PMC 728.11]